MNFWMDFPIASATSGSFLGPKMIKMINPDIIVKGSDYLDVPTEDIVGSDLAEIKIVPASWSPAVSTTKLIERIVKRNVL